MLPDWLEALPRTPRVLIIAAAAVLVVLAVRAAQRALARRLAAGTETYGSTQQQAVQAAPKLATVSSLAASTIGLAVFFIAVGLILDAFDLDLTAYFATATVVGLAVGFGSQGLVQDIVIGLTLIFTDALDVGDTVEIAGQTGRVERVGLRFTTLTNFLGQTVYVPNRNIGTVGRFRRGVIRAYVDVQAPADLPEQDFLSAVENVAQAFAEQHAAIVLGRPELSTPREVGSGGWRYVRVKLRLWPGQGALVETALRQRLLARMKELDPAYADYMVTVAYRAGGSRA